MSAGFPLASGHAAETKCLRVSVQKLHRDELETAVRSDIEAADRRFCEAVARGDVEAAAREVYTADAVILPPGAEMIRGREDIISFWREAADTLSLDRVEVFTVELRKAGEFVHQVGRAVLTVGGEQVAGKYTVLWRQENGQWKWHVDCWNLNS